MTKHGDTGKASRQARRVYKCVKPAAIHTGEIAHFPVVVVGGGPIGLTSALDLARHGIQSVVLEKHNSVSDGSRAICWSKRTLEILDRIGASARMMEKGVVWNQGWVYFGRETEPIYKFDLLPDKEQKFPAFINLQQFYAEEYLIDLFPGYPQTEIRWQNEVVGVANGADKVIVTVRTPVGEYRLSCDYLLAADGHRSPLREALGLDFTGRMFEDNFLIADVRMKADFPAIRRFWFDPPFNPGQTSLLHKQADDVWRIDFQMGWDIDRDEVMKEENIDARIKAFLGSDLEFDYEWVSLYTFKCCRMEKFVHGRVIFVGDSAHLVSPFGARGANGGLQDVDNLIWKLHLVLTDAAPPDLLNSYDDERILAAEENVVNSSRSTDFMTPKSEVSLAFRNATLELAKDFEFARRFVNPGRLSTPSTLGSSPLNTADEDEFSDKQRPGSPCLDAPVSINGNDAWFLNQLGERFVGIYFSTDGTTPEEINSTGLAQVPVDTLTVTREKSSNNHVTDSHGLLHRHYDAEPGTYYLVRPDQHVTARWRQFSREKVLNALARATAR